LKDFKTERDVKDDVALVKIDLVKKEQRLSSKGRSGVFESGSHLPK